MAHCPGAGQLTSFLLLEEAWIRLHDLISVSEVKGQTCFLRAAQESYDVS